MKVKLLVLSALAAVWLVCSAGPITSLSAPPNLKEVGKIKTGTVFIDLNTVQFSNDGTNGPLAAMVVKVRLNKPLAGAHSVDNATVFSCRDRTATVVASTAYDAQNVVLSTNTDEHVLPWIKGRDGAIDVIMKRLCAGYKPPLPRGVREA